MCRQPGSRTIPFRRAGGLSLVELMVALLLGAFLVAALIQFFLGNRLTWMANEGFARVQESGRFALEDFKRELRESGTHGFCAARLGIRNHLNECDDFSNALFDPDRPIAGFEYRNSAPGGNVSLAATPDPDEGAADDWSSSTAGDQLPTPLQGEAIPGSDVVIFRRLELIPGLTAVGNTPAGATSINLTAAHGLPQDSIVLVTNCASGADIFQNQTNPAATSFSRGAGPNCTANGPGNSVPALWSTAYDPSMQVYRQTAVAWYLGRNEDTGEPGLYRMEFGAGGATRAEIIEGVENLQVLYGYSRPAAAGGDGQSVNNWLTAEQVPDWGLVIAIRMEFIVRSPERSDPGSEAESFVAAGVQVNGPDDGRIRKHFSTTAALRNRMLTF